MIKNSKTNFIVKVAILGALSGILMMFKFPTPIAPSFYKLEFSDVAALLGGFALGPTAGLIICLIKNLINLLIEGTTTAFIGELSNLIMSSSYVVVASMIYKRIHTKKGAIKSLVCGIISLCFVSCIINYYVVIPAYVKFMNFPLEAIIGMGTAIVPSINSLLTLVLLCTLPFNLIKGICVSIITYVVYKRVSPLLH